MSQEKDRQVNSTLGAAVIPRMLKAQEGMPVPAMQPIKAANGFEQKGAPIPNMQPVQQTGNTPSGGNNQGTGASSGQAGAKS